jgi:hypothetical protein
MRLHFYVIITAVLIKDFIEFKKAKQILKQGLTQGFLPQVKLAGFFQ